MATGEISEKEREYRSSINEKLWLIDKPYKYKKWTIWPNTILNNMKMADCDDTINGVCLDNKSLEQCIDRCTGECAAGVYFKFHDGKSICIPLRTAIHPSLNPIYHLRRQDSKDPKLRFYDIEDVDVSVFVNTDVFSNPPDQGNAVFYYDIISLKNKDNFISTNSKSSSINTSKDISNNVQIIPQIITAGINQESIPLKYGDKFNIMIPGTNITASNKENNLIWTVIPIDLSKLTDIYFTFNPPVGKKIGDIVTNNIPLVLKYENSIDSISGFVNISNNDIIIENQVKTRFNIISKMVGYFCDKGNCNQISLKHITSSNGSGGKYKDSSGNWKPVYRNKGCWNLCNNEKENENDQSENYNLSKLSYWVWIIIGISIVITIVIIYVIILKLI